MASTDTQIDALHAAGLRVIVAGEDDKGRWMVSVAKSRTSPMQTWKAGSGPTFAAALAKAMGLAASKAKPKPEPVNDFEGIL